MDQKEPLDPREPVNSGEHGESSESGTQSEPGRRRDPGDAPSPPPERIEDSRRQALNEKLTLAVGQGRIDLSEFSELSDAVWSVTDAARFRRLEELISGKTGPREFKDLEKLAEKAAPPPTPPVGTTPPHPGTTGGPTKSTGQINSFSAAINSLEASDRSIYSAHPTGPAVPTAAVPTQSLWFGDLDRAGDMRLAAQEGYRLVFGDLKLDLRDATLTSSTTYLHVSSVFGDVKLTVPPGVRVENRMSLLFGDVKMDQGPRTSPGAPTVVVVGRAVFGDLRVAVAERGEKLRSSWRDWLGW